MLLQQQPWATKLPRYFMSRTETYVQALACGFGVLRLMREHKLSMDDGLVLRQLLDFPGGLELHFGMYIPTIQSMATDEQKQRFLREQHAKVLQSHIQSGE